jgi:hypothetical protein
MTEPELEPQYRDITGIQEIIRATQDNIWGPDTEKRLNVIRKASAYGGKAFPYGKAFTQSVIGVRQDGVWGPKSSAAHGQAITAIQRAVGAIANGIWSNDTEAYVQKAKIQAQRPERDEDE